MTEPIPFPTSPYCRVRARVASIWADGPDDGTHPDWRPAVGEKVVLTPSIGSQLLTYDVGGADPIIVTVERVDCVVGADGFLTKSDGRPVYIAPTDDPLLSATGWTWAASIKGKSVPFSAPTGGVVELAMFIAAPATDNTKTWVERIPELVALIEEGTDPATIGAIVEDYLAANPPVSDATAITKGVLRLAGDLGGTADAPTVPGLIDLSDKVEWIKQNGEIRVERIVLNEPGDSYVIPSGWKVSHLKAGGDGAVLEIPYAQYTLGPGEYAGSWVKGLYGTLTLVSGSISQGAAIYEDHIYVPYSHLSDWNPHPMYAMKESLPAIIVGPGRPDAPATTGGAITGSEPVGAEYRSTDGAGVGAWVWMKRPTGWVVTDGDTGWRNIATSGGLAAGWVVTTNGWGACRIRRIGDDVLVQFNVTTDRTGLSNILLMPDGMRPQTLAVQEVILRYGAGYNEGFLTALDMYGYWGAGGAALRCNASPEGGVTYAYAERLHTKEPWPTTLPGTPA